MREKLSLFKFKLTNSQIIKDTMNLDEIELDLTNRSFIGIIGDNGCGKTTIINEMLPVPIYGNYIIGKIGKKELWYISRNKNKSYYLLFNFEPNGDKHSCKGYFHETDLKTGIVTDLNPNGSFDGMISLIEDKLGVNRNILNLYHITHKLVFIANMTTSERLGYLLNIIKGLVEIKATGGKINSKLLFLNKLIKANENKLSRLGSREYMQDSVSDINHTLKILNRDLDRARLEVVDNDKIKEEISVAEYNIRKGENNINTISNISILISKDSLKDYVNEDTSLKSLYDTIKNEIAFVVYDIENIEKKMAKLDSDILIRETENDVKIEYSNDEFDVLDRYFAKIDTSELTEIMCSDIDDLYTIIRYVNRLKLVSEKFRDSGLHLSDIMSVADRLLEDTSYNIKYTDMLAKGKAEIAKEIKELGNKIVQFDVITTLVNELDDSKCSDCFIASKLKSMDTEHSIYVDKIKDLEDKYEEASQYMERYAQEHKYAEDYLTEKNTYNNIEYRIKMYVPDFDFDTYLLKPYLLDDAINMLNHRIKEHTDLQNYKKIKEIKKLSNSIADKNIESIAKLREDKIVNTNKLDNLYKKKNELCQLEYDIDKLYSKYTADEVNKYLIFKPKYELNKTIGDIRNGIENYKKAIIELNHKLKSLDPNYIKELESKIKIESDKRDKITADIILQDSLVKEIKNHSKLKEELDTLYDSLSSRLVKRVVRSFMHTLKVVTNNITAEIGMPYKVDEIIIDDKEFRITILNEITSVTTYDISRMSSGEISMIGMILSVASSFILDIPYDILTLDEADTLLSEENRKKFISTIMSLVTRENKQAIMISHNGNFGMYSEIALIGMRGAAQHNSNEYIFKYDR